MNIWRSAPLTFRKLNSRFLIQKIQNRGIETRNLAKIIKRQNKTEQTPDANDPNRNQNNETFEKIKEIYKQLKSDCEEYYYKNTKSVYFYIFLLTVLMTTIYFWDNLYPDLGFYELLHLIELGEVSSVRIQTTTNKENVDEYMAFSILNGKMYKTEIIDIAKFKDVYAKSTKLVDVSIQSKLSRHERVNLATKMISILFLLAITLKYLRLKATDQLLPNQIDSIQTFMKTKALKISKEDNITKRFRDVAGMDEAKLEITEFVEFLKNKSKFDALGAKIPKGALLFGPPGTGKTLLGKACAGEAGVPFFYVSGSEFTEVFVGVGSSRVRDLFNTARENAPCIVFIDEIDAVAKKRSDLISSNSESDSTLNQLLVEMDGFTQNTGVTVFGATNRKELLDPALLRPGRLDRLVEITLPDLRARKDIFKIHLAKLRFDENEMTKEEHLETHSKRLASLTPGFSGADIENICNEAAIQAVRTHDTSVKPQHFESAVERVIGGIERRKFGDKKMKRVVAVHESGHGVVSWFLEGANPLLKLTIIPRSKGSLGFAQYLPKENSLQSTQELMDQIVSILAGRCAENVFFGEITTGAYDDFQKAYKIAYNMVTKLGMSEKIGHASLEINEYGIKKFSQATNQIIDEECKRIINECTQKSIQMVEKHRDKIEKMSELLLEKETIDLKQIVGILGPRPFLLDPNFKSVLEHSMG